MATSSARDVPLTLSVETLGTQSVVDLQDEVRQLAKEGGDAAPAFNQLADELGRLGEQSTLVATAKQLSTEIEQLGAAQELAASRARELSGDLSKLGTTTASLSAVEAAAKSDLEQSSRALFDKRQQLAALKNDTSAAAKEESAYTRQVKALNAEIIVGKTALRDKTDAYKLAKAETALAATAEATFARSVKLASDEVAASKKSLDTRNAALATVKTQLAASALATDNVVDAERQLVAAYDESLAATISLRNERDRLAVADKQLAFDAKLAATEYRNFWSNALNERDTQQAQAARKRAAAEEQANARMAASARDLASEESRLAAARKARASGYEAEATAAATTHIERERARTAATAASERAAKESAQALSNAFRTVGTPSVEELRAEIVRVKNALDLIKSSGTLVGKELDAAFASGARRVNELEREIRAATGQATLLDKAGKGLKSTFGQFAAAFGVVEIVQRLGTAFLQANVGLERLRLGLKTIYKDTAVAGTQIDFLRNSANAAGVSFSSITDSFVKFAASTTAANIPIAQTNELFQSVTRAAGTLGLSGDRVTHILDALSQMAAKGVVSMEELRQQLGDSLPGALSLTAKGLGLTEAELIKLVESGGLLARDLFPALTASLKEMGAEVFTVQATWERFKNILTQISTDAGDTGAWDGLKYVLATLGVTVNALANGFSLLFDGVITGGRQMVAAATLDFDEVNRLGNAFLERQTKQAEQLQKNAKLLYGLGDATAAATSAQVAATSVTNTHTAAQTKLATAMDSVDGAQQRVVSSGEAVTASVGATTVATDAAAVSADLAGQSWQRLSINYAETVKILEQQVANSEKLARAKEIEGQSAITLAGISGNETSVLQANAFAKLNQAAAIATVVQKREDEISNMASTVTALRSEQTRLGDVDGARGKFIAGIEKTIEARQAELEKAEQEKAALDAEAATRVLAIQVNQDHADSVDELRAAYESATAAAKLANEGVADGVTSREQTDVATRNAAIAERLYRDALDDTAAAAARTVQATRDKSTLSQAALNLDVLRSQASEALASAMGNETAVLNEQITQKRIEIDITRQKIAAMESEAAAVIQSTQAQIDNLRGLGELTPAKEAELQSRIANAKAMQLEAQAGKQSIAILEAEILALRNNTNARNENTASRNKSSSSKYDSPLGDDKYSTPKGGIVTGSTREERLAGQQASDNTLLFNIRDKLNAGTLGAGDEGEIRSVIDAIRTNAAIARDLPTGLISNEGQRDITMWNNVGTRLEQYLNKAQSSPKTVNVNMGGKTTSVNTASDEDSEKLVNMLRSLESASARTY